MAYSWELATIDAYEPLQDPAGWLRCPTCNEHPRTWVFDNGNYARCRCIPKYQLAGAAALSIIEAVHKRRMPYDEYKVLLRDAWNEHVRTLPLPAPGGEVEP